ncbi:MAG: RDD family protein [Aquimonas sp.]|nr:RDD family protein [Aquimonas sp.]
MSTSAGAAGALPVVAPLDTRIDLETPEGVHLHLHPAGVVPRALAWVVDAVVRLAILWTLSMGLMAMGPGGQGLYLIGIFALLWLYPIVLEVLWNGQTLGKKMLGLRVVHADGTAVGWLASFTRNLLRTADMLPLGYAIGVVSSLFDPRSRRLGDMAAGTLVIHVPEEAALPAPPDVPARTAPVGLLRVEREALIGFAERHRQISHERQVELARLLPGLQRLPDHAALAHVLGTAAGLLGHGEPASPQSARPDTERSA